jgi:hypothetical protein
MTCASNARYVAGFFEDVDNPLGRQSVLRGVLPRSLLSLLGPRAGAAAGVPAVGFELARRLLTDRRGLRPKA